MALPSAKKMFHWIDFGLRALSTFPRVRMSQQVQERSEHDDVNSSEEATPPYSTHSLSPPIHHLMYLRPGYSQDRQSFRQKEDKNGPFAGDFKACSFPFGPRSTPKDVSLAGQKILFLVRSYNPTPAQLERVLLWRDQCHAAGVDFLISFDRTYVREKHFLKPFTAAELHLYSQADMESEYPAWRELIQALPRKQLTVPGPGVRQMGSSSSSSHRPSFSAFDKTPTRDAAKVDTTNVDTTNHAAPPVRYRSRSMAWGLHCECVAAAVAESARRNNGGREYDYIWVFEDDVGYSGENIVDLLEKYAPDESDLLTHFYEPVPKTWVWRLTMTEAFYRRVGHDPDACVVSAEHVQRFSGRLVAELERWSRAGAVSWSESMTPTVCLMVGMRCGVFRTEDIGFPFKYDGMVGVERWREICGWRRDGRPSSRTVTRRSRGKSSEGEGAEVRASGSEDSIRSLSSGELYHALKF